MKQQRKPTDRDAKAVTYMAWQRYRDQPFRTSAKSPSYAALLRARDLGFVWFMDPTTAAVTGDGVRALSDYGVPQP
jgi:hypothetical protein